MLKNQNKYSLIYQIPLILLVLRFTYILVFTYPPFIFLDNFNLLIHEAGHWIFYPFGEFLNILGGSLTQIIMPALFIIYFWKQSDYFSTGFCIFWFGDNLINVATYISDAQMRALPLIGYASIHDWNYLLSRLNILGSAELLGSCLHWIGVVVVVISILVMFISVFSRMVNSSAFAKPQKIS